MLMELDFILAETRRKISVLLFVDNSRYLNDSHYEFGKMFNARITLSHVFKEINKNVTEQLTSNSACNDFLVFLRQF